MLQTMSIDAEMEDFGDGCISCREMHRLRWMSLTPSVPCISSCLQPARSLSSSVRVMSSQPSSGDAEVLFSSHKNARLVTLNRPKALNALSLTMVRMIHQQLEEWQKSSESKLVIVQGAGDKAFCAGGDIRSLTDTRGSQIQKDFFSGEYLLDGLTSRIRNYIALIDGIVMGGGVGISVHGRYRVATERSLFAMPETGIGLIPDVGGSFFLPRLPYAELGTFLALTGHRLKGPDCFHAGIATHLCQSSEVGALREELLEAASDTECLEALQKYHSKFEQGSFSLEPMLEKISSHFSKDTVEEIVSSLEAAKDDQWAQKVSKTMSRMSPTSLKVALRQLREGKRLATLEECLQMEYRLVRRCCEDSDFYEGVRALIVDKDNQPQWNPRDLAGVTQTTVDRYFSKLPQEEELTFPKYKCSL